MGDPQEDHPMWEQQVLLERGMLRQGADAFRDRVAISTKRKQMTNIAPVRALIKEWLPIVAGGIKEYSKYHAKNRGPTPLAVGYLDQCDPYVASLIALRAILDGITVERAEVTKLALEIGETVEHELQVRKWEAEEPRLFHTLEKMLKTDKATPGHRARVHIDRFNHHLKAGTFGFEWQKWPMEAHFRVGVALIDIVVLNTGWFDLIEDPDASRKKRSKWHRLPLVLTPKAGLVAMIGKALDDEELRSATLKPTLMPPKRWEGTRKGGYFTPYVMVPRLIRFKAHQEDQKDRAADEYEALDMPEMYDAIHRLQEVPWRVNSRILELSKLAWAMDREIGGLPLISEEDLPIRSGKHQEFLAKREDAVRLRKAPPVPTDKLALEMRGWRRKAKHVKARNARKAALLRHHTTIIQLGEEFDGRTFYFPHNLDFRGRMYPIPAAMQPQGSDLARALLDFDEGKPLGETGGYWLAVSVANHWGNDKISFDDRVAWVQDNEALWRSIVADPLGNLSWSEAGRGKTKWQALAAIIDWVGALDGGDSYVSRRPCVVDGTCNGIQHLSAIVRDQVAGSLVNLVPSPRPQDIYQEVANRLQRDFERIAKTRGKPAQHARWWLTEACPGGKLPRSLTKRQTMVLPYGGTPDSCFTYTEKWFTEERKPPLPIPDDATKEQWAERMERIRFCSTLMWGHLGEVVSGGVKVMNWLRLCAKAVTEGNQPIFWVTPSGFVVRHFYGKLKAKQIGLILNGERVQLSLTEFSKELDVASQLTGIPPNFIHSIDASCLTTCINAATTAGITAFTAVHDAYGTHAADMWTLYHLLREAFVETHKRDILGLFRDGCRRVLVDLLVSQGMDELDATTEAERKLPPPLPMGTLDIEGVLTSDYFFA